MDSAALSGNDQHKSINAQDPASASVTQASTNDTTLPYSDSLNHPASAALAPSESQNTAAYDAKHSGQGAATGGVSSRQDFEGQRFNSPAASVDRTDSVVATPPLPSARQSPSDASQHQERHLQEDATSSLSATGAKGVFDHSADVRSTTNAELPSTSALTADAPSMGSAAPHVSEQQQPNPIQPSARIPGGAGGQDPSVNSDPSFSTQPSSAAFARPAQPTSSSDSMLTSRPRESPLAASSSRRDAGSFSAAGTSATSLAKPSRSSEISPVPVFPGMPVPNAASVGQQTALVHTSAPPVDSRALQVQAQRERERARALDREQRERERERDMHREAEEARLIWL